MRDVIAEAFDAQREFERKREEAIPVLLERRLRAVEEIDAQLAQLGYDVGAGTNVEAASTSTPRRGTRGLRKCSPCGTAGHTARTCTAPTLASAHAPKPRLTKNAGSSAAGRST